MARWRDPIWASAEDVIRTEVDAQRWLDQALSLGCVPFLRTDEPGSATRLMLDIGVRLPAQIDAARASG